MFHQIINKLMNKWRRRYTKILTPIAEFFLKIKVTPNIMTSFSTIFGLLAVWFLFQNQSLFILFVILHLLADMLDGTIARFGNKITEFGKWFDHISDRAITFLAIIKSIIFLKIPSITIIILLLFLIHHITYIVVKGVMKKKTLVIYSRTIALVLFGFGMNYSAITAVGILSAFGILLQILYGLRTCAKNKKHSKLLNKS